jgi:hypothetical protein
VAMSQRNRPTGGLHWVLGFLAAVLVTLAAVFGMTSTSASAAGVAKTRVGAFNITAEVPVGSPQHIAAGQRLGEGLADRQIVVATGVAAEAATGAVKSYEVGTFNELRA